MLTQVCNVLLVFFPSMDIDTAIIQLLYRLVASFSQICFMRVSVFPISLQWRVMLVLSAIDLPNGLTCDLMNESEQYKKNGSDKGKLLSSFVVEPT